VNIYCWPCASYFNSIASESYLSLIRCLSSKLSGSSDCSGSVCEETEGKERPVPVAGPGNRQEGSSGAWLMVREEGLSLVVHSSWLKHRPDNNGREECQRLASNFAGRLVGNNIQKNFIYL
jgi:hypothetical protein